MPRILRRYPSVQLVLVLSLVLLLVSLPVAQNRLVGTSLSLSRPSATGTGVGGVNTNVARPGRSKSVLPEVSPKQSSGAGLSNTSAKAQEAYGVLPLSFEANSGQTNRKVKFLARGQGYGLFLTATGPVVSLTKNTETKADSKNSVAPQENAQPAETAMVSWEMVAANKSPRISGDVCGATYSTNFPTTAGALQTSKDLSLDGFLTKLNASGSSLIYSTILNGRSSELEICSC